MMTIDAFFAKYPERLNRLRDWYVGRRLSGQFVPDEIAAYMRRAAGDYGQTRLRYWQAVYSACVNYLSGGMRANVARTFFVREMMTAFVHAFETGYLDGSRNKKYDPDPEDVAWLSSMSNQEAVFIRELFVQMREVKKENPPRHEIEDFAADRADGYCRTLDGIYSQAKLRSNKSKMLTFTGVDGQETCKTCQKYKGQRHRASWWLRRGLVPSPGNSNFECGCWRCQHGLYDDDGVQWAGEQSTR